MPTSDSQEPPAPGSQTEKTEFGNDDGSQENEFWIDVLRSSLDATLVFNRAGALIFANEEAEDLLGHTGETLLGIQLDELGDFLRSANGKAMAPEAMPFRRVFETGEPLSRWRAIALTRYGELRQVLFNVAPLRRAGGIEGLVTTLQAVGLAPKIIPTDVEEGLEASPEELAAQRNIERSLRLQEALFQLSKSKVTDLDEFMEQLTSVDAETIQVERVGVWLFDDEQKVLEMKKLYQRSKQAFSADSFRLEKGQFPRYFAAIHQKRIVATSDAQVDPRTNELAENYLIPLGITSMMDVPIWLRGKVVGIVCHENVGKARTWSTYERQFAASIAGMMSVAIETRERVKAEVALRKNEERLRLLTEQLPALVWTTDINLKITSAMGSGLVPLNLKPNLVEGVELYELLQAQMPTHPLNVPQHNALKGESVTYDGDWQGRNYQIHVEPFRDPAQQIIGTIGVALDTTERHRAEEEIRLLQSIILSMVGVESVDEAFAIALEKVCLATGWVLGQAWVLDAERTNLVLCHSWFTTDPALEPFHKDSAAYQFAPGIGIPGRVWLSKKPEWHVDVSREESDNLRLRDARNLGLKAGLAVPVMDGDQVLAVLEFFRLERSIQDDRLQNLIVSITMQLGTVIQRKRVEHERKKLLDLMRTLVDTAQRRAAELETVVSSIVDGVLVLDADARLVLANRTALDMLGMEAADMLGMEAAKETNEKLEALLQKINIRDEEGRVLAFAELPMIRALAGKSIVEQTLCMADVRTGQDVYLRVTAAPIAGPNGKGAGAVSVARDITEQRAFSQMKDQFIRVTAHELKTPLSIMKGYSEMILRQGVALPEQVQKMLEAIDRGADRIVRIVNDLLDISRFGKLEMPVATHGDFHLSAFVTEAVQRNALDATHHRIQIGDMADVTVNGDKGRIEQVLNNLLQNARKYSPEGGEIVVSVDKHEGKGVVCVKDFGIGIPKDKQPHIFQQFYRAHADSPFNYGGMGVGLYISREIILRHRGEMWFTSEPGQGSTFCFSLPAVAPA